MPFARTDLNVFCAKLKLLVAECGDKDFITIEAMKGRFKTEAWKPLGDENSVLYKFLTSLAFKREGLEANQLDRMSLIIFALLNCPGKTSDRCEHFFNEL